MHGYQNLEVRYLRQNPRLYTGFRRYFFDAPEHEYFAT